jgi:hypothetical protein
MLPTLDCTAPRILLNAPTILLNIVPVFGCCAGFWESPRQSCWLRRYKVFRVRDLPIRPFARCLAAAIAIVLLAGEAAWADCTPGAANTVTCTGTTTNQGGGAPADGVGYGTGGETGVTVNVESGASIYGDLNGFNLGDATVNNAAAGIAGGNYGIRASTGFANVSNSGSITGITDTGILAETDATVTNNDSASIAGGSYGIDAATGFANVINSGSITGTTSAGAGIRAFTNATVTNNDSASIAGRDSGIAAGIADVTNSGSITGTNDFAFSPTPTRG